jgi:hypothetical protein
MAKPAEAPLPLPVCSLLLFVATSAEEDALQEQAAKLRTDSASFSPEGVSSATASPW